MKHFSKRVVRSRLSAAHKSVVLADASALFQKASPSPPQTSVSIDRCLDLGADMLASGTRVLPFSLITRLFSSLQTDNDMKNSAASPLNDLVALAYDSVTAREAESGRCAVDEYRDVVSIASACQNSSGDSVPTIVADIALACAKRIAAANTNDEPGDNLSALNAAIRLQSRWECALEALALVPHDKAQSASQQLSAVVALKCLASQGRWEMCASIVSARQLLVPIASPSTRAVQSLLALALVNARHFPTASRSLTDYVALLANAGLVPAQHLSLSEYAQLLRHYRVDVSSHELLSPSIVWRSSRNLPLNPRRVLVHLCAKLLMQRGIAGGMSLDDLFTVVAVLKGADFVCPVEDVAAIASAFVGIVSNLSSSTLRLTLAVLVDDFVALLQRYRLVATRAMFPAVMAALRTGLLSDSAEGRVAGELARWIASSSSSSNECDSGVPLNEAERRATLLELLPSLSGEAVTSDVLGRCHRLFSWQDCLAILNSCGGQLASHVQSHLQWTVAVHCPAALRNVQIGSDLSVLNEQRWECALALYANAPHRLQTVAARRVLALALEADVLPSGNVELVRMAVAVKPSDINNSNTTTNGGSDDDEQLARNVLRAALAAGQWYAGLECHRVIASARPKLSASPAVQALCAQLYVNAVQRTEVSSVIAHLAKAVSQRDWHAAMRAVEAATCPIHCELNHVVHCARYVALVAKRSWEVAAAICPFSHLPLPMEHAQIVQALRDGKYTAATTVMTLSPRLRGDIDDGTNTLASAKRRRAQTPATQDFKQRVESAFAAFDEGNHWQRSVELYMHVADSNAPWVPYASMHRVVSVCQRTGQWEECLRCFDHMSQRMRPDLVATVSALEACASGSQWQRSLTILQQAVLTQGAPSPSVVHLALHNTFAAGMWAVALRASLPFRSMRTPQLVDTLMELFTAAQRWNEAVDYFYSTVQMGIFPQPRTIELALVASSSATSECRALAKAAESVATVLEDICRVSGAILEHVTLVHRNSKVTLRMIVRV